MPIVSINIQDRKGKVSKDPCKMSKKQEVEWISTGGNFTVVFQQTPFADSAYIIPDGGSVCSGLPKVRPDPAKEYKYTVFGPDGSTDPIIVVDR